MTYEELWKESKSVESKMNDLHKHGKGDSQEFYECKAKMTELIYTMHQVAYAQ